MGKGKKEGICPKSLNLEHMHFHILACVGCDGFVQIMVTIVKHEWIWH
jgi:hypothetical protein